MAVAIVMFLVTIIAHGVTPALECWGCWGMGSTETHPCNDTSNFDVRKCREDQTMCHDTVVEDTKYMIKDCLSEEEWKKEIKFAENQKGILKICNTTKCNTRIWQDYFPVPAINNAQIETHNLSITPAPEGVEVPRIPAPGGVNVPKTPAPIEVNVPRIPAPEGVNVPRTPAPEGVKVTLKKCHKLPSTPSPLG